MQCDAKECNAMLEYIYCSTLQFNSILFKSKGCITSWIPWALRPHKASSKYGSLPSQQQFRLASAPVRPMRWCLKGLKGMKAMTWPVQHVQSTKQIHGMSPSVTKHGTVESIAWFTGLRVGIPRSWIGLSSHCWVYRSTNSRPLQLVESPLSL